jgi:hypothetical protein
MDASQSGEAANLEIALLPGLTWSELTGTVSAALRTGGCRGWSIAVDNPDLDPGGQAAAGIVTLVTDAVRDRP